MPRPLAHLLVWLLKRRKGWRVNVLVTAPWKTSDYVFARAKRRFHFATDIQFSERLPGVWMVDAITLPASGPTIIIPDDVFKALYLVRPFAVRA